jgi:hypothetical protein
MFRRMIVGVIAALSAITVANAQTSSKVIIGGVDQRVPAIENQVLAQQVAEKSQQMARVAAMLTLEQEDRKAAEARAANLREWLDLAWPSDVKKD